MTSTDPFAAADQETLVLVYVVVLASASLLGFIAAVGKNIAYTAVVLAVGLAAPHYMFMSAMGESPMPAVLGRCAQGATRVLMRGLFHYDEMMRAGAGYAP
jgi:hypothetical protein